MLTTHINETHYIPVETEEWNAIKIVKDIINI